MRTNILKFALALTAAVALAAPVAAQSPVFFTTPVDSVAGVENATTGDSTCILVKYVGSTAGKPTVEAAAGGDLTFKIAGSADTTTGSPSLNGVFDLSTPAAAVDTMGELVTLINTTGSNWKAVLVNCLASDLTDNAIFTLSATDASAPAGVSFFREATSASASSVFTAQAALLPADAYGDAHTNIRFWLTGSPVGNTTGSAKVNPDPFAGWQTFVQHIRENITSSGTVALFEILGVKRTYDSTGKVSDTVRRIYAETGANTTVEKVVNFHNGPVVLAPGEIAVVRQSTGTDLTAIKLGASGYFIRRAR